MDKLSHALNFGQLGAVRRTHAACGKKMPGLGGFFSGVPRVLGLTGAMESLTALRRRLPLNDPKEEERGSAADLLGVVKFLIVNSQFSSRVPNTNPMLM